MKIPKRFKLFGQTITVELIEEEMGLKQEFCYRIIKKGVQPFKAVLLDIV